MIALGKLRALRNYSLLDVVAVPVFFGFENSLDFEDFFQKSSKSKDFMKILKNFSDLSSIFKNIFSQKSKEVSSKK